MRRLLASTFLPIAAALAEPAFACAPPPPGWVPPTQEQRLEGSLRDQSEIVYGVVTGSNESGSITRFKVIHVYLGVTKQGQTIVAPIGFGHPTPVCAGMGGPPAAKKAGTYGVIAFNASRPEINFISPDDVQLMIRKGWIQSARQ